jgi:hypothetical protein
MVKTFEPHGSIMCIVEMVICDWHRSERDKWGGDMFQGVFLMRNHTKPSVTARTAPFYEFLKDLA